MTRTIKPFYRPCLNACGRYLVADYPDLRCPQCAAVAVNKGKEGTQTMTTKSSETSAKVTEAREALDKAIRKCVAAHGDNGETGSARQREATRQKRIAAAVGAVAAAIDTLISAAKDVGREEGWEQAACVADAYLPDPDHAQARHVAACVAEVAAEIRALNREDTSHWMPS